MKILEFKKLISRLEYLEKEKNNYEYSLWRASSEDYKKVLISEINFLQKEIDEISNIDLQKDDNNANN